MIESVKNLEERVENCRLALEILESEEDKALENELVENLDSIEHILNNLEEKALLSDEYDSYQAVVTIHPGAGGTESQDWAEMLFRMYTRWMDKKKFTYNINDYQTGEEAGIKNVTFTVKGKTHMDYLNQKKASTDLLEFHPLILLNAGILHLPLLM